MRKKIVYAGLSILAIAAVLFFVSGTLYGNALSKVLTTNNLTISSGGFSFAPVQTANASLVIVYAASSGNANMYLFNTSAFHLWSIHMNYNRSASGLAYARVLDTGSASVISSNTSSLQIILTKNLSAQASNRSVIGLDQFNGTAYVVIDNTNGSYSYNSALKGAVSYFRLTSASLGAYNNIAIAGLVIILLGVAGIIITIYGVLKKAPDLVAEIDSGGITNEPTSKEYIDSLYKNVGKDKGKKKNA